MTDIFVSRLLSTLFLFTVWKGQANEDRERKSSRVEMLVPWSPWGNFIRTEFYFMSSILSFLKKKKKNLKIFAVDCHFRRWDGKDMTVPFRNFSSLYWYTPALHINTLSTLLYCGGGTDIAPYIHIYANIRREIQIINNHQSTLWVVAVYTYLYYNPIDSSRFKTAT